MPNLFLKVLLFVFINLNLFCSMYVCSVAITFSSKDNLSLYTTCISLDYRVGCTLLHVLEFVNKNPIVKAYLKNRYYITNLTFKYSDVSSL